MIYLNPGAGPIEGAASPEQALFSMEQFVADIHEAAGQGHTVTTSPLLDPTEDEERALMGGTRYSTEHDGRFPFRLNVDGHSHVVEMPGIPLKDVRFIESKGQRILDFPRLYVDGSSWIWKIAILVLLDPD